MESSEDDKFSTIAGGESSITRRRSFAPIAVHPPPPRAPRAERRLASADDPPYTAARFAPGARKTTELAHEDQNRRVLARRRARCAQPARAPEHRRGDGAARARLA